MIQRRLNVRFGSDGASSTRIALSLSASDQRKPRTNKFDIQVVEGPRDRQDTPFITTLH